MSKTLFVTALALSLANIAQAQTSVTLYGIADAALVRESGGAAGPQNKLTSGAASASRLGFKGSEDLGAGMSALFMLEMGYKIDSGEVDTASTIFNRQAFVGLKGTAGTVTLGRQYTPWHNALASVGDPFATGMAGGAKNLFPDSGANVRSSNTVMYASPVLHGLSAELAYSAGEQASIASGRQFGGAIGYVAGPLSMRLAYNSKNSDVAPAAGVTAISRDNGRNALLAANYDFRVVKVYFTFGCDKGYNSAPLGNAANPYGGVKPTATVDGNEMLLGLSAPLASGTLLASYMRKNDKTVFDQDAHAWGLGYLYPMSSRSTLYGSYAVISNRHGAGYTVANNSETGSGNHGLNLGLRHTF